MTTAIKNGFQVFGHGRTVRPRYNVRLWPKLNTVFGRDLRFGTVTSEVSKEYKNWKASDDFPYYLLVFTLLSTMLAVGSFVIALLAIVSSGQQADVISSCTTPNTVALTFVSVFPSFFQSPLNVYNPRMTVHIYISKEIRCFATLILDSHLHFWFSQEIVNTLDAAGVVGTFFFSMFMMSTYVSFNDAWCFL